MSSEFRGRYAFYDLFNSPREADGCNEIEHQTVVGITLPSDVDEELTGDGMGHEDGSRVSTEKD